MEREVEQAASRELEGIRAQVDEMQEEKERLEGEIQAVRCERESLRVALE